MNLCLNRRGHFNRKKLRQNIPPKRRIEQTGVAVMPLIRILEVFDLNLCRGTGYPDDFRGFPQSLQVNFVLATRLCHGNFGIIGVLDFVHHPAF
jgi:hypothetical protein